MGLRTKGANIAASVLIVLYAVFILVVLALEETIYDSSTTTLILEIAEL